MLDAGARRRDAPLRRRHRAGTRRSACAPASRAWPGRTRSWWSTPSRTTRPWRIAREFTDRVLVRPWPGFAAQKNFAIEQARGEWILSLDADERVSPELARTHPGHRSPRGGPRRRLLACRARTSSGVAGSATAVSIPTGSSGCSAGGRGRFVERGRPRVGDRRRARWRRCRGPAPPVVSRPRGLSSRRSNRYSTLAARGLARAGPAGPSCPTCRAAARAVLLDVHCARRIPGRLARASCWPSSTPTTCSCAWPRLGAPGRGADDG